MRALIIASVSRASVIVPCSTSLTNCLMRSLPRSRAASSLARRPSSTIESSRLFSCVVSAAAAGTACWGSAIVCALHFQLQLLHFFFALDGFEQNIVQFFFALETAAQIGQLGAQLQHLTQRLHLAGYVFRLEIVHALKMQVHPDAPGIRILAQFVLDEVRQMRLHAGQHAVEVIESDLHKFAIFQTSQRLFRLAGEIAKNAHYKRQFLQFDGIANFYVVGDLNSGRADPLQLLVYALTRHDRQLLSVHLGPEGERPKRFRTIGQSIIRTVTERSQYCPSPYPSGAPS